MDFEWDEDKSNACFAERGSDFAYAAQAFFDPDRLIRADLRHSYGEDRFQLSRVGNRAYVLAYTPRAQAIRIISARKANAREVKHDENGSFEN